MLWNMSFSKIFEHIGNSDTGRSLFTTSLQFFLWTGAMFPIFQSSGKIQIFSQFWNIMERYLIIDGLLNFTILIEIPSYPWAKSILKSLLKKLVFYRGEYHLHILKSICFVGYLHLGYTCPWYHIKNVTAYILVPKFCENAHFPVAFG